ncbi:MAG TPA: NAD(P)-binding domain-containing protein [Dissulfurispiraceae bacterium]|nr:NAD(P)-binding domain-containing protein [Dissulfurispiraceae bacterium]
MSEKSVGFVGGGRIVRIMLQVLKRAGALPATTVVSDPNLDAIAAFPQVFPGVRATTDNREAAAQEIVFLAVHPTVVPVVLPEIRDVLKPDAILISLSPQPSIGHFKAMTGGFDRIVRLLPNAPSFVGSGYNPVVFSPALSEEEKKWLKDLFSLFGSCPEVAEEKIPAYALLTAMGPTYFWFQIHELHKLAESFGLTYQDIQEAMFGMLGGTLRTYYMSQLPPERVMDLVSVKPLADMEESIRETYRTKLPALYEKIR